MATGGFLPPGGLFFGTRGTRTGKESQLVGARPLTVRKRDLSVSNMNKKLSALFTLALAAPAIAGTEVYTARESVAERHVAQPAQWGFFAGASAGYLSNFEEDMFHVHAGVDTPWQIIGWNVALFAEVGWTETDAKSLAETQEFEIIPMTFNLKLERPITERFSVYMGAGVGAAMVDYHLDNFFVPNVDDNETVLAAQAFAGVAFNATSRLEIYGGARWIYVDFDAPPVVGVAAPKFGDDFLVELGLRYNF